ncbi:MAG: hypothetical protein ACR2G5_09240 [Pyrinomonadaceae bacterium]
MKIVLIITVLEILAVAFWMLVGHSRKRHLEIASGGLNGPWAKGIVQLSTCQRQISPMFDTNRWHFLNAWQVNPQADDRRPMFGGVTEGAGPPSVRRAVSRRSHQVKFKEWSKNRSASGTG